MDYFILQSVFFWRGSAWPEPIGDYNLRLGKAYTKKFKDFLLTGKTLEKVILVVEVNSNRKSANDLIVTPVVYNIENGEVHRFHVNGITFHLYCGQSSNLLESYVANLTPKIYVTLADFEQSKLYNDLVELRQTNLTLRGELGRKS